MLVLLGSALPVFRLASFFMEVGGRWDSAGERIARGDDMPSTNGLVSSSMSLVVKYFT